MEIDPKILGLTGNELKAYGALVQMGVSRATAICKESGVPHGKIYQIMDSLVKKGLVDIIPKSVKEYAPNNPNYLLEILDHKKGSIEMHKQKIQELKENFESREKIDEDKIIVRQGNKEFYKVLKNQKDPKVYNYSIKWKSEFHSDWAKKQKDQLEKGVDVKVLTRYDEETKNDVGKYLNYHRNIKKVENDGVAVSLQDNETMITLPNIDLVLLIKDPAFAKLFKKMFLETYKNAERIK